AGLCRRAGSGRPLLRGGGPADPAFRVPRTDPFG
ncbi:MAG: hypothetical protein AVDCRST_MAG03-2234, partial [uncultured Rubrobacteraceae bacterium]